MGITTYYLNKNVAECFSFIYTRGPHLINRTVADKHFLCFFFLTNNTNAYTRVRRKQLRIIIRSLQYIIILKTRESLIFLKINDKSQETNRKYCVISRTTIHTVIKILIAHARGPTVKATIINAYNLQRARKSCQSFEKPRAPRYISSLYINTESRSPHKNFPAIARAILSPR